jgi:aminopeptidase N
MKNAATNVFSYEKNSRAPIYDRDTEDLMKLLNANNYQKGSWVLHMLRSTLGDEDFFRGIRKYYETHKNSTATTEDLRLALEKASGQPLYNFFARWVYATGHPEYDLRWVWLGKGGLRLNLRQVQRGNAFVDQLPSADGQKYAQDHSVEGKALAD